ncbi:hypothetical protein ABBQ32_014016 [Trebouxia sp. C0010 RCD-2024]
MSIQTLTSSQRYNMYTNSQNVLCMFKLLTAPSASMLVQQKREVFNHRSRTGHKHPAQQHLPQAQNHTHHKARHTPGVHRCWAPRTHPPHHTHHTLPDTVAVGTDQTSEVWAGQEGA